MHKAELFNCYSIRKIGGLKRAYEYIWILLMLTFFAEEDERLSINGKPLDASRLAHTLGIDEALASEALVVLEAFDFIEKHHRPLYCGEFGVIANADIESQKRWYADVIDRIEFDEDGVAAFVDMYLDVIFPPRAT